MSIPIMLDMDAELGPPAPRNWMSLDRLDEMDPDSAMCTYGKFGILWNIRLYLTFFVQLTTSNRYDQILND